MGPPAGPAAPRSEAFQRAGLPGWGGQDRRLSPGAASRGVLPNDLHYYGTPTYSAPEQFIPGKQIGPATDVFSNGA